MYEKVVTVFPPNNSHLNPPDSLSLRVSLVDTLYFKTRTQNKASHLKTTDFYKTRQYDTSAYSIFRHERRLKIVRTTALTSYVNLLQVTKKKKPHANIRFAYSLIGHCKRTKSRSPCCIYFVCTLVARDKRKTLE